MKVQRDYNYQEYLNKHYPYQAMKEGAQWNHGSISTNVIHAMVKYDYVSSSIPGLFMKMATCLRNKILKGLSRSNTQFVISNHEKGVNVLLSLSSYFLAHSY